MAKHDRRVRYQSDAERPVTVSLRIPHALYERVERYASEHRQTVSELVRDGIEMRLDEPADPRSRRAGSTTEDTELRIDGASILRDMQATLARHETQMQALMQAIERQSTAGNGLYSSNTAIEPEGQERAIEQEPARGTAPMDAIPEEKATVLQDAQPPALAEDAPGHSAEVPAYDTTRLYLGKLCPKGHTFAGTGMSLLRKHNQSCRDCENERKKARRQARRQTLAD